MTTIVIGVVAVLLALPLGWLFARWVDGEDGVVIRRTQQLMRSGLTRQQAERQAEAESARRIANS